MSSTKSGQIKASQNNLRAFFWTILWPFPILLFFEVMVVQARSRDLVLLLSLVAFTLRTSQVHVVKKCEGVGFVRRPHLIVGWVHSVTTYPRGSRRAAGTAGDWRRIKRRGSWMEWRAQSRRVTLTSCMDATSANTRTTWATRCGVQWVKMTTQDSWLSRRHWCRTSYRSVSPRIRNSMFSSWCCSPTLSCHRQLRL